VPVVFRAVVFKLLVWCEAEGYVSGLQDAAGCCSRERERERERNLWCLEMHT